MGSTSRSSVLKSLDCCSTITRGSNSIILLALVDGDYKFLWVDVGQTGSSSYAQIFNQCELKEVTEDRTIGFPPEDPLPKDDRMMPYFILGDDAFALKTWLMKPFSQRNMTDEQRIFNYWLSRDQRIVENSFGILANRFQYITRCLINQSITDQKWTQSDLVIYGRVRRFREM